MWRSVCAERSVSTGSMNRAVQSAGSSSAVSNQAGADQSLSVPSVQTLTLQTIRCRDGNGSPGHGTRTQESDSTRS